VRPLRDVPQLKAKHGPGLVSPQPRAWPPSLTEESESPVQPQPRAWPGAGEPTTTSCNRFLEQNIPSAASRLAFQATRAAQLWVRLCDPPPTISGSDCDLGSRHSLVPPAPASFQESEPEADIGKGAAAAFKVRCWRAAWWQGMFASAHGPLHASVCTRFVGSSLALQ